MSNGIAVGMTDYLTRDYWYNGTCCSGYSFRGNVTEHCLKAFKFGTAGFPAAFGWDEETFKLYSKSQKLAVPEQLVWWNDE